GERWRAVLAFGAQTLVQLNLGRAQIGCITRIVAPYADQRVRFVRARAQNAARPVVLERAPNQMHAVGEQRRGKRVPCEPLVAASVEAEAERAGAVDSAAFRRTETRAHAGRCSPIL